jgi:hypothetical protein
MRSPLLSLIVCAAVVHLAGACTSESVNNPGASGGGTAGAAGGTGGVAGQGGSGGATGGTGSTAGAAGSGSNACAYAGDAGDLGKWPDSKTAWCSGSGCVGGGEDGDYATNPPSYSTNGNVIKDQITGLEWRKDVISDQAWSEAGAACAALNATDAGADPWRLPTRLELTSLLDYGASSTLMLLPIELDPPTKASNFWSSSESAGSPTTHAWAVSFQLGSVGGGQKTTALYSVRCVRGAPPVSKLSADASCEVVTDAGLGLMWQRPSNSAQHDWPGALAYCEGLSHAGFDDWRLPSIKELMTIVLDTAVQPAIDTGMFGTVPVAAYWSSTPRREQPADAYVVDFALGTTYSTAMTSAQHARCVRSLP